MVMQTKSEKPPEVSWWQAMASAAAGLFGVQSSKNRERDFTRGDPVRFIVMGAALTCALVTLMLLAVRWLLLQPQ